MIKKFIFFPIWKIDELENSLKEMEKQGYRLDYIKYSYWFYFKESNPKNVNYFMSYNNSRKLNCSFCDSNILSNHHGHKINSCHCFYNFYRTTESKDKLDFLYEIQREITLHSILELFFTAFFMFSLFFVLTLLSIKNTNIVSMIFVLFCTLVCLFFTLYYLYAYIKQKQKIKKWEKNNLKKK